MPLNANEPESPTELSWLAGSHSDEAQWQQSLLDGLTPPQRSAVEHTEGALLVLAAAGSGKTRVITRRIAYIISLGVPAWNILALTFTNKAAGEMRERVHALLGGQDARRARGLTVSTFHALCARLLRRHAPHAGLKEDFAIFDSGDQAALVKKTVEKLQLSTSNFPPRVVLSTISRAKNQLLDADAFAARAHDFSSRTIAKVYQGYQQALAVANAVDYDDLLLRTARMLRDKQEVREELRTRWKYLLIDEYQDTNQAQFVIASMLAGEGKAANVCVVGDPDQAIYGWRGADISNILDFERSYPGCTTIALGENFRSTRPILGLADSLIRKNKLRKHKDLFTSTPGGNKATAVLCQDERAEARAIADWLRDRAQHDRLAWKDMAIFYRTNALSRVLEEALREAGVPYTIARGTAFYDREEVKNALSYLRVVANQADDVSLERIINTPARGISDASVDKLSEAAGREGTTLMQQVRTARESHGLTSRAVISAQRFASLVDAWTGQGAFMGADIEGSLAALVDRVIKESGLEKMYAEQAKGSGSEADQQRLDNLAELVSSARDFESEYDPSADAALSPDPQRASVPPLLAMLRGFLESVALVADADSIDPANGSVTLMTLHAAKGLEYPAVAIVGMEELLLPHSRAVLGALESEMEEERRLCFVGITRAMRHLMLSAAKYRTLRGVPERTLPSRFLAEMDPQYLDVVDKSSNSPGWDSPHDQDDKDFPAPSMRPTGLASQFSVGCKVRHPQFGVGTIEQLSGGGQSRAVVRFAGAGVKTLILEHARLTRV